MRSHATQVAQNGQALPLRLPPAGKSRFCRDAGLRLAMYRITPGLLVPTLRYRPGPCGLPPLKAGPGVSPTGANRTSAGSRHPRIRGCPPWRPTAYTGPVAAHVSTPSGQVIRLTEGSQLVFGRGPEVDLAISAGRGLSRRAGVIAATPEGAWIANISKTHALYVAGDGYRIRLPRVEGDGDPAGGRLARDAGRRAADRGHRSRQAPAAARVGGCGRPGAGGQCRHRAAALPRPEDQALPGGVDVVPAVAARPERRVAAAAHPGDRQGRA